MTTPALMQFQQAIKQQTDDLREELNDLAKWEEEIAKKEADRKKKAATSLVDEAAATIPPIRGTVPSLKAAVAAASSSSTKSSAAKRDLIQEAKEDGNEYFRRGEVEDAIRMYTRGIDHDPDSASTHVLYANRAMCYLKQQKWELAEKDATICIQMNRGFTKAFFRRAQARKQLKKYRDARSDLETVLALTPTGDAETEAELKAVTQLMHEQDAQQQQGGAPKRKKLVIAEVEDEDDEGEEAVAPPADPERQERIERDMALLQAKRNADAAEQQRKAAEAESQRQKRRQANSKVEVIEEEEEEPVPLPPKPSAAPKAAAPTAKASPAPSASPSVSRDRQSQPQPRAIQQEWTVENLKPPKNFTEFERVYKDTVAKPALWDHYISVIPSASLKTIVGVNLFPELLVDLLKSAARGGGARAKELLLTISALPRVEELAMFFNDSENQTLQAAIQLAQSAGATAQELAKIKKAFA